MIKKYQPRRITVTVSDENSDESMAHFSVKVLDITNPYTRNRVQDTVDFEINAVIDHLKEFFLHRCDPHLLSVYAEYQNDHPTRIDQEEFYNQLILLMLLENIVYRA